MKGNMSVSDAKIQLSNALNGMTKAGFGNMEMPFRIALFECISDEDYTSIIIPALLKHNPELSARFD